MSPKKAYKMLEHTADAYIAAYGKDLSEAFQNAATALFDVMTEVEHVASKTEEDVGAEGHDIYSLLYNWLETLLVKSEIEGMLYSKFKILELREGPDRLLIRARIWGERFDPRKHLQKVGVKAVTYHNMEVIKSPDKVTLKFILDI